MRRTALVVVTAVLALAGAVAGTEPAAAASDTAVALPLTTFKDLVLDEAHGHVFISGGGVVVRTLDGAAVATISGQAGATQLALSDDSSTLFVLLPGASAISAVDTTTLTETARYDTGNLPCLGDVVYANQRLVFSYGCIDQFNSNLGIIDLTADSPTATLGLLAEYERYTPVLGATPAKPGLVFVGLSTNYPATLKVLDLTSGSVAWGATRSQLPPADFFSFTSDGSQLVTGRGDRYRTSDLASEEAYTKPVPRDGWFSPGPSGLTAWTTAHSYRAPDLYVFREDRSIARTYEMGGDDDLFQPYLVLEGGMAFTADASRLLAVAVNVEDKRPELRVLHDPTVTPTSFQVIKPVGTIIDKGFVLTGRLVSNSASQVAIPGATVTVVRDSVYGKVLLPSRRTASDGSFAIADKVTKRGVYGYSFHWAGDSTRHAATARFSFYVKGLLPALSIPTSAGPWSYGAKPVVVAHLGTTRSRSLALYAQAYQSGKVLVKKGTVNGKGDLAAPWSVNRRITFSASFAGDDTYEPRTVAKTLLVRAKVVNQLVGSYATSGSYKLFHTSVDPGQVVTVYPNHGGSCVDLYAERYRDGAWHASASLTCAALDGESRARATLISSAPAGTRFRLKAVFRGSVSNARTVSAWQYGRFTT